MEKKEIIALLILNNYSFKEADKGIDVNIKKSCRLTLIFQDDLLVKCEEKVKRGWTWITCRSLILQNIIGLLLWVLVSIWMYKYVSNKIFPITIGTSLGFIIELLSILLQFKKAKKVLQIT